MAGIITIEDVIERIIKEDIDDETEDHRMDSLNNPFTVSYPCVQRFTGRSMYKACITSNADRSLPPHHFQHYTASGAAFKLQRLARIKSIAAAFKLKAKQTIEDRDASMKHNGYLRMQTNSSPVTVGAAVSNPPRRYVRQYAR